MEPGGVFTVLAYHLQYALVADSVVHSDSSVGSLSLLHAECQGGRAYGKDPRVVEIAEVVIEPDLVCLKAIDSCRSEAASTDRATRQRVRFCVPAISLSATA